MKWTHYKNYSTIWFVWLCVIGEWRQNSYACCSNIHLYVLCHMKQCRIHRHTENKKKLFYGIFYFQCRFANKMRSWDGSNRKRKSVLEIDKAWVQDGRICERKKEQRMRNGMSKQELTNLKFNVTDLELFLHHRTMFDVRILRCCWQKRWAVPVSYSLLITSSPIIITIIIFVCALPFSSIVSLLKM